MCMHLYIASTYHRYNLPLPSGCRRVAVEPHPCAGVEEPKSFSLLQGAEPQCPAPELPLQQELLGCLGQRRKAESPFLQSFRSLKPHRLCQVIVNFFQFYCKQCQYNLHKNPQKTNQPNHKTPKQQQQNHNKHTRKKVRMSFPRSAPSQ